MLFTLFTGLYITCFCWLWGLFMLHILKKSVGDQQYTTPHFSIVCLIGLAGITVVAAFFSLFIPLGGWEAQLIIIIPGILFFLQKKGQFWFKSIKQIPAKFPVILLVLFIACCLLSLIMSTWKVNHPDTLYYHAQTIQWIEKYKAIPGLVHLHVRYGYQGLWFVSSAIFGFRFTGIESVTTLNFVILTWFFLFVIHHIHISFFEKKNIWSAFLWLVLLIISLWSYTQVRLTATSASPDFIAALFLWLIFYLLLNKKTDNESAAYRIIIIFLCLFAVTIKLSAFPVLMVACFMFWQIFSIKKMKPVLIGTFIFLLTFSPFVARNIITTGFVAFPSPLPDIVNVDWKFSKELTTLEKDYITGYAKGIREGTRKEVQAAAGNQPVNEWLPNWWELLSGSDKFLVLLLALSLSGLALKIRSVFKSDTQTKVVVLCMVAGIVFWFVQAPDPRFGFGFMVALPAFVARQWLPAISIPENLFRRLLLSAILILTIFISGYLIYRVSYYFSLQQLIKPAGFEQIPYSSFTCNDIGFKTPENGKPCGNLSVPCTYTNCATFDLRGKDIRDGFKAK